jgi:hypothetical protein
VSPNTKNKGHLWVSFIFLQAKGLEEGGIAVRRGKKHAGDMFFSPGESPWIDDGSR